MEISEAKQANSVVMRNRDKTRNGEKWKMLLCVSVSVAIGIVGIVQHGTADRLRKFEEFQPSDTDPRAAA